MSLDEMLPLVLGATLQQLSARPSSEQDRPGFTHTLREILQQPATWTETARRLTSRLGVLTAALASRPPALVLTGSGSSQYVGDCLALGLQEALLLPVQAVAAGTLLTHPRGLLTPAGGLVVSFARSGDSPESCGAVDAVREAFPSACHLIVTCNAQGQLATEYAGDERVHRLILDDRTCDRSLVMTSSFTNLFLAGRALAYLHAPAVYEERVSRLARLAFGIMGGPAEALAGVARGSFRHAVYLGSGVRHGSAREAALKMLEMSSGEVKTLAETYLGLRHGPMSAVDGSTLVVAFLSCDPVVRAYECDLLQELRRKGLGAARVLVGEDVPAALASDRDVVVDLPGLGALGDPEAPALDVVVGQLLAFFRCLHLGLKPDLPSAVIGRVVEGFTLHR